MRQYNEIVVGHSLAAAAYAYLNDAPLIINKQGGRPFLFDFFEEGFDLSSFLMPPVTYDMASNAGTKTVGASKSDLWERLIFSLAVSGRLLVSDKAKSIRIDESSKVVTVIVGTSSVEYGFERLRIFNTASIRGLLPASPIVPAKVRVLDWFNVRSGCCHEYDHLHSDHDLAREIYFYPSPRAGTKNHNIKDLVAVSFLTAEQLNDIEYSDVAVRFKILNMMKGVGIRGARNGRDQKKTRKI